MLRTIYLYSAGVMLLLGLVVFLGDPVLAHAARYGAAAVAPYDVTAVVAAVNEARVTEGLAGLASSTLLTKAAQAKAEDMVSRRYFSHTSPDGEPFWTFVNEAEYQFMHTGENLAVHYQDTESLVTAWLNSPTHRENIMNYQYTETGIGIARGKYKGDKGWFVVQLFGTPYPSSLSFRY
jgi:uncharacterized protein YkwD